LVSVIGKNKVARHNNYASADVCKGSGVDASELVEIARRHAEVREMERDINDAERSLRHARAYADKANAWASKCLDDVMRLRVKLAAMQPAESIVESEAPAPEIVAMLEAQS